MRIIKYPNIEEEKELTCCWCEAVFAYTNSDCEIKPGLMGDMKNLYCPVCDHELKVQWIPCNGIERKPTKLDITW